MKKLVGFDESAAANPFGYTAASEQQNLLASVISNHMDDEVQLLVPLVTSWLLLVHIAGYLQPTHRVPHFPH
jgi:hypothetical protein